MEFPETFDEFVESCGFIETEEVYTNGSQLIPVFRVKQWLEHIKALSENKGEWRHYEGMLYCSECGAEFYDEIMEYTGDEVPKHCPDCGADMRGKADTSLCNSCGNTGCIFQVGVERHKCQFYVARGKENE